MVGAGFSVVRRARNSFAYRSSSLYRFLLGIWSPRRAPVKPPIDVMYLTFAGAAHLAMLRESVSSLANGWDRLPRLRVVGDGTLAPNLIRRALKFWPSQVEALDWRELVPEVRVRGYDAMVRFAERVPMARKMLAVVASASQGPTMYADVDVLWFGIPRLLSNPDVLEKPRIVMSTDFQPTYDLGLVPSVLPHLASPPFYCAGILFANKDFFAHCEMGQLFQYAAEHGTAVTEQTLLAEAGHQFGKEVFSPCDFALTDIDRFTLRPSFIWKRWVARHYIGQVRHLFWRDALALRVGLGRGPRSAQ